MTYNEKRSIYESIMKQISADVKRKLNEDEQINVLNKFQNSINSVNDKNLKHNAGLVISMLADVLKTKQANIVICDFVRILRHLRNGLIDVSDITNFGNQGCSYYNEYENGLIG